jgi:hypothetical protein
MTRCVGRRAPAALALAAALFVLSGCSGQPSVSGTVAFNGQPVDGGIIVFIPEGPVGAKIASAQIVDGKFYIPSGEGPAVGKNRVEITWPKKTGKKVPTPGDPGTEVDETVQVIPNQYNTGSTLSEEIKAGSNEFKYDLKGTENAPGKDKGDRGDRRMKDY